MTAGAMPPPQFQPYPHPLPPPPRRAGVHGFPVAAAVLALVAAGLLIFGSFLPYTEYAMVSDGEQNFSQQTTGWEWIMEERDGDGPAFQQNEGAHPPRYGITLTVAAAVLLIGAFVTAASAGRRVSAGVRSASRLLLSTATAAAVVAVWMVALGASSAQSLATPDDSDEYSFRAVYHLGTGLWVLVCGGGVALLALLVAWLPTPGAPALAAPVPGVQMYLEPRTPAHGFALQQHRYQVPPPAPPVPEPYISPFTQVATTESITSQAEPGQTEGTAETPADGKPAEGKHAAEVPAEGKPAAEASTEAKTAEKESAEEKVAEGPTAEKSAAEKEQGPPK